MPFLGSGVFGLHPKRVGIIGTRGSPKKDIIHRKYIDTGAAYHCTFMICCGPSLDPACWQRCCLSTLSPSLQWPTLRKEGAIKVMKDAGVDISSFTSDAMADAVLKTESSSQGLCVHVYTWDVVLSKGAAFGGPGTV